MTDRENRSIYRFKLSPNIIELIENFSRLHMYSSREVFKEKWKEWLIMNKEQIDIEKIRLKDLGYTKNVDSKMYTATRYYFKKKEESLKDVDTTEKDKDLNKSDKNTRGYIVLDEKLVGKMDEFIKENKNRDSKPSDTYEIFRELHKDSIDNEVKRLKEIEVESLNSREKCLNKIKKTYKNRCYVSYKT